MREASERDGVKVQTIVSVVMLMLFIGGAFWALAYSPINGQIADMKAYIASKVSEAVFAEYKIEVGKDILRLERDIQKLEAKSMGIVGREETQKDWDNNKMGIAALSGRVDRLEGMLMSHEPPKNDGGKSQ